MRQVEREVEAIRQRRREAAVADQDQTLQTLVAREEAARHSLLDAEKRNLKAAVDDLTEFSAMLGRNTPRVDSIVGSLNRITGELADAGFARRLTDAVDEVNGLLAKVEAGEGTVGKLMNDPALYDSLTEASANLASLLANLEQYPGRYVHFSLFGRSPEKMQEKAERKAAKAAARAERDSVKRIKN